MDFSEFSGVLGFSVSHFNRGTNGELKKHWFCRGFCKNIFRVKKVPWWNGEVCALIARVKCGF
jgi:hypothetical protein